MFTSIAVACWSNGMIHALDACGSRFDSWVSPPHSTRLCMCATSTLWSSGMDVRLSLVRPGFDSLRSLFFLFRNFCFHFKLFLLFVVLYIDWSLFVRSFESHKNVPFLVAFSQCHFRLNFSEYWYNATSTWVQNAMKLNHSYSHSHWRSHMHSQVYSHSHSHNLSLSLSLVKKQNKKHQKHSTKTNTKCPSSQGIEPRSCAGKAHVMNH